MFGAMAAGLWKLVLKSILTCTGGCASRRNRSASPQQAFATSRGRWCWPEPPAVTTSFSVPSFSAECRGSENINDAAGLFINTLPIRIKLGCASVQDNVSKVQESLADLLSHEHASLALAQRCSGVQPPAPLFTSLFNYRHVRVDSRDQKEDNHSQEFAG